MRSWLGVAAAAAFLIAGCGDDGGSGGSGGGGGNTGGTGGATGGTGGSTGGSTTGGTGGATPCGGIAGVTCGATEYCDFPDDQCGAADGQGECKPRPNACNDIYAPVCTCDGTVAPNDCDAAANGNDVSILGGCTPPDGMFACGIGFCDASMYYCQKSLSDVGGVPDSYTCAPLPDACNPGPATCACLAGVACGDMCAEADGGLTVTCPGG